MKIRACRRMKEYYDCHSFLVKLMVLIVSYLVSVFGISKFLEGKLAKVGGFGSMLSL